MAKRSKVGIIPSGRLFGYARVSTIDQDLTIQSEALIKFGCPVIFAEQRSGAKREGREELEKLISVLSAGDSIVVLRLDRLGRSIRDVFNIVHEIEDKGAHLKVIEQPVDTSTAAGKAFLGMLAVFAQFETDVRRERQLEGVAKAKGEGKYRGAKPRLDRDRVAELAALGVPKARIARDLKMARSSVHRLLDEIQQNEKAKVNLS